MIGRAWSLEWSTAIARRRLFAWNVAVPLLLLAPIAFSAAAAPHRAAVYAVFIAFFGTFGTCIPLIRDGASGWIEKQRLTGYGDHRWIAERVAAGVTLDMAQLLPAVMLLAIASEAPGASVLPIAVGGVLGLIAASLIGVVVAAVVRSLAEGALACAAVALFTLHFSGVFRSAPSGTWAGDVQSFGLFGPLAEAARLVASGAAPVTAVDWAQPVAALGVLIVAVGLAAPTIIRRLGATAEISQ